MVSDQFKRDYRQMTAQGVTFTPEDIVRLNALSVKTRRSATAARDVYLPRLAFMPRDSWWRVPLVLREPTVAHDLWLEMAERFIDTSKDANFLFLYAFALSRHPGKLPDPTRPSRVVKAVCKFASKRLARFTSGQLRAAVEYALFGNDWTVGEVGQRSKVKGQEEGQRSKVKGQTEDDHLCLTSDLGPLTSSLTSDLGPLTSSLTSDLGPLTSSSTSDLGPLTSPSPTLGLLADARMLRLGISTDDALRMTSSELTEAINRVWDLDKRFDSKRATSKAFGEYVRAREEIRNRSAKNQVKDNA